MKENTEVVVAPKKVDIEMLLQQAIEKGIPVDTMERLLAMRRELKQEAAKEAFDRDMAGFQSECPTIKKTKSVKTDSGAHAYSYAPIESIVAQVKKPLQKYGFSYSTNMELKENGVKVAVKVTHTDGHAEITEMEVPFGGQTKIMSKSQVAAAASTFAKRYAFCNAFGILTGDEDTDAAPLKDEYDNSPIADDAPAVTYGVDEPEQKTFLMPTTKEGQKLRIFLMLRDTFRVDTKDPDACAFFVQDNTGLTLEPKNYVAIIKKLHEKAN